MHIDLYTRCWNDAEMLEFFFRHYDRMVARYFVYDDGSTDGSQEILQAHPKVELRRMPDYSDPQSRVASNLSVLETCWTESRGTADWVIVTDIDEHLHHADFAAYLAGCKAQGVTIVPALGFQMLTDAFPGGGQWLCETPIRGAPWPMMNKLSIFAPDEIEAVNFQPGRHMAAPTGRVVAPPCDELMLLHYRYLGFERTLARHENYLKRQRQKDLAMGWGEQYSWSSDRLREEWDRIVARLVDVPNCASDLKSTHPGVRWWEPFRAARSGGE